MSWMVWYWHSFGEGDGRGLFEWVCKSPTGLPDACLFLSAAKYTIRCDRRLVRLDGLVIFFRLATTVRRELCVRPVRLCPRDAGHNEGGELLSSAKHIGLFPLLPLSIILLPVLWDLSLGTT